MRVLTGPTATKNSRPRTLGRQYEPNTNMNMNMGQTADSQPRTIGSPQTSLGGGQCPGRTPEQPGRTDGHENNQPRTLGWHYEPNTQDGQPGRTDDHEEQPTSNNRFAADITGRRPMPWKDAGTTRTDRRPRRQPTSNIRLAVRTEHAGRTTRADRRPRRTANLEQ
jgi:hypothetical protein